MNISLPYIFDNGARIWKRPDAAPFRYSDGEAVENQLLEIVKNAKDKSVLSPEIAFYHRDWPRAYHFSAKRSNLLRPFANRLGKGARILELGSGCGAITRYLGECGGEVIAVEGSPRRAQICATRCEGLYNVTVINDTIGSLPEDLGKFDVVTLIGVLEYSALFTPPDAALNLLVKAKSFLKPGGIFILALENKLGLKYLAGVPEDHLGVAWSGVINGYRDNGVKTWSRKELVELLTRAGFESLEQFIPVPDYKLPVAIISQPGLEAKDWDYSGLLLQPQRAFEEKPPLNMREAWKSIIKAGLVPELADSLCFVCQQKGGNPVFTSDDLALYFGSTYSPKYAKSVRFIREKGKLLVKRERLCPEWSDERPGFRQEIKDEPWHKGQNVQELIEQVLMRPRWTMDELCEAYRPWLDVLKANLSIKGELPSNFVDMTPFNLIIGEDGVKTAFDLEWIADKPLKFESVFTRGVFNSLVRIGLVGIPADPAFLDVERIIQALVKYYRLDLTKEQLKNGFEQDALDTYIFGVKTDWNIVGNMHLKMMPPRIGKMLDAAEKLEDVENCLDKAGISAENMEGVLLAQNRAIAESREAIAKLGEIAEKQNKRLLALELELQKKNKLIATLRNRVDREEKRIKNK